MIGEQEITKAVEDFVMQEMKRIMVKHMNEVLEDSLVEIMQQVVIKLYRGNKLTGINFDIELKAKNESN